MSSGRRRPQTASRPTSKRSRYGSRGSGRRLGHRRGERARPRTAHVRATACTGSLSASPRPLVRPDPPPADRARYRASSARERFLGSGDLRRACGRSRAPKGDSPSSYAIILIDSSLRTLLPPPIARTEPCACFQYRGAPTQSPCRGFLAPLTQRRSSPRIAARRPVVVSRAHVRSLGTCAWAPRYYKHTRGSVLAIGGGRWRAPSRVDENSCVG